MSHRALTKLREHELSVTREGYSLKLALERERDSIPLGENFGGIRPPINLLFQSELFPRTKEILDITPLWLEGVR
jgi:hypothetical protein